MYVCECDLAWFFGGVGCPKCLPAFVAADWLDESADDNEKHGRRAFAKAQRAAAAELRKTAGVAAA